MTEAGERLRGRLTDVLLDQVADVRYPSGPMLDRVERAVATREQAEEYVNRLIDLIEQDRYPSPTMVERVTRLAGML